MATTGPSTFYSLPPPPTPVSFSGFSRLLLCILNHLPVLGLDALRQPCFSLGQSLNCAAPWLISHQTTGPRILETVVERLLQNAICKRYLEWLSQNSSGDSDCHVVSLHPLHGPKKSCSVPYYSILLLSSAAAGTHFSDACRVQKKRMPALEIANGQTHAPVLVI